VGESVWGVGGSRDLLDERVLLLWFELAVRLEPAMEGAVVMLGVIVMEELREVAD
jgi:hypothetical protein